MSDSNIKPNKFLDAILKDYVVNPPPQEIRLRSEKEQIQDLVIREVGLSREVIELVNSQNLTLEETKRAIEKDRARRYRKMVVTKEINRINAEIAETKSARTTSGLMRLQKLVRLRELQREKDNLRMPNF